MPVFGLTVVKTNDALFSLSVFVSVCSPIIYTSC